MPRLENTAIRLVGGPTKYEGRLEVYESEKWGTVCDDGLNDTLSVVVCRSLGLPWNASKAYGGAAYGQGSGPIWLDNVKCMGSETGIEECSHNPWGSHNCNHGEDVSISCFPSTDIVVRLVGGTSENEGRLEVNRLGGWGTVCDDNLNDKLAVVVCRSLGLPWATSEAYGGAVHGQGSGSIWLDNVNCIGSESNIAKCSHSPWGSNNCNHGDDVSINCLPNDATFVRIVGGTTEYEGRLEIYKLGRWGTVCDNNFNHNLSVVVCRSLGLPWATSEAYGGAVFGRGSGTIWLDNVNCIGSESKIEECSHSPWGSNNCNHGNDISINCLPNRSTDTAVRLVGGTTEYEGRLEVYKSGKWGTVCDDGLNDTLSVVVCRSLGLPWNASKAYGGAAYGQGSGPIWLDNVKCMGSETGIEKCSHNPWGSHNCNHGEDVSISCFPSTDIAVRLVGGTSENEGRLEVKRLGGWGTVCDDNLNDKLAVVVCRSLGLPWATSEAYGGAVFGRGSGTIWLDNVNCIGSESKIEECSHSPWGSNNCNHGNDISINCLPNRSTDTAVRLVGGTTEYEGRLEVYKSGKWGTVCDDGLNDTLSVVVCRSLGLPWNASKAYGGAAYGQGSGPIWLDNVKCMGSETGIEECSHNSWGSHNCNHGEDVSISCFPPSTDIAVRLVGGTSENEGRLEVNRLGSWGTVCDDNLNDELAVVVCRSLGLPWATSEAYGGAVFGRGSGTIWLDNVNCIGSESNIAECSHSPWGTNNCNHGDDVSINCLPNDTIVRLVGGTTEYEGRLEVYKSGKWGTVCDDGLNDTLSVVVCRSLGLPWSASKAYGDASYGQGSGPIWLDDVKCTGSESRIEECSHSPWGSHNCGHGEDVSILCVQSREDWMYGANAIIVISVLSILLGLTWLTIAVFVMYKKRRSNLHQSNTDDTQGFQLEVQSLTQHYDDADQTFPENIYSALGTPCQETSENSATPYEDFKI
uniref:Deleted in malignant brain tumors 1 protein n=1 Tax=Magallana gigas TaxID=29159 RepID=K1R2P6_MAGGI